MSNLTHNVLHPPDGQPADHSRSDEAVRTGDVDVSFKINGTAYIAHGRHKTGRDLLRIGGFNPTSDHVLIRLLRPGSILIGIDQDVDLGGHGALEFMAFHSGEVFPFTVEEVGYVWGAESIREADLRDITGAAAGTVFVLEREDEPDEVIEAGESLNLAARGTEHIRIAKRLVTVFYGDDQQFELERRRYAGAQLGAIFGMPAGYELDVIRKNGKFDLIEPGDTVKIKEGMRFVSHPPSGQSS